MSLPRLLPTVLLSSLHLGCALAAGDAPAPLGKAPAPLVDQSDMRPFPLSNNGLLPGLLVDGDNLAAMANLADGALAQPTTLADSDSGRRLFGYIARCALTSDQRVAITDSYGQPWVFEGLLGLAPGWTDGSIDDASRRWISACLLAHANAYGRTVKIELLGSHPALAGRPSELTAQEAAFYGDLFQGRLAMTTKFACVGSAPGGLSDTPARICGRTEACGFTITGTCGEPSETPVCSGGPDVYTTCAARPIGEAPYPVDEVITVYTDPSVLATQDPCPHAVTEAGFPLAASCSAATATVCAADAYCCAAAWDETCVAEAAPPRGL